MSLAGGTAAVLCVEKLIERHPPILVSVIAIEVPIELFYHLPTKRLSANHVVHVIRKELKPGDLSVIVDIEFFDQRRQCLR